jgi:uncharacterized protein (TIGR02996 family)
MSTKPLPTPAIRHPDEFGLLAAVLANPADDLPKLVYADWLDERNDPRGTFLRQWLKWRKGEGKLPKPPKDAPLAWLNLIGYDFDVAVAPFDEYRKWEDKIRGAMRPGLAVKTKRVKADKDIPIGASKVGGCPDLTAGTPWPMNKKSPMAFLGQWNLDELAVSPAAAALPRSGVLSFFVDLQPYLDDLYDEPPPGRVLYTPGTENLERQTAPEDLPSECRLKPCRATFTEGGTVPGLDSWALRQAGMKKEAELREYAELVDLRPKLTLTRINQHQILGHPQAIQEDPASHKKGDWVLLTQFSPDSACGLDVGDGGEFYFLIRPEHLAAAKFDRVYMELQMG